jgi:5-aminopentanamidase
MEKEFLALLGVAKMAAFSKSDFLTFVINCYFVMIYICFTVKQNGHVAIYFHSETNWLGDSFFDGWERRFRMKVAAYQGPLDATSSMEVLHRIREQVDWCESNGVEILCCPEGVLGGLADYSNDPNDIAMEVKSGQLQERLAILANDRVTTILGFTEIDGGRFYNSAAIFHQGSILGIYRKLYPAIHQSIYEPGDQIPVFTVNHLTFGILLCRDSNYYEPARILATKGATTLFIPTNNGLPPTKGGPELVLQSRKVDMVRAIENGVFVVRADVAGRSESLISYGSSGIVDPDGVVLQTARQLTSDLLVADIQTAPRKQRPGWDAFKNGAVMEEYFRVVRSCQNGAIM